MIPSSAEEETTGLYMNTEQTYRQAEGYQTQEKTDVLKEKYIFKSE